MTIYYCLTVVLILPIALALGSLPIRAKQLKHVDLENPRAQATQLTGAGERIINAQKNAWEALIIFSVAIFIATSNNVSPDEIAIAGLVYVGARLAHAAFYIAGKGVLRFLSFIVGFAAALWIVYTALV